ncbi:hypothetical protein TWF718_006327 [Orbilia javanica]|uniref:HNH nuclease domain-containing protein n=1 Tax=Orbilia javanica TaxID=47235 RepID=A0AAN8MWE4_9PEZI
MQSLPQAGQGTPKELRSPFKTQREEHPLNYCKHFIGLSDKRLLSHRDKSILLALLAYTTNEKLFKNLNTLEVPVLQELAHLAEVALKNLRNWGGRPATTILTPKGTPSGSRPQSRQGSRPQSRQGSRPRTPVGAPGGTEFSPNILFNRVAELQAEEGEPETTTASEIEECSLGKSVLDALGYEYFFPEINATSFSRSARFGADCKKRQQSYCLLTGLAFDENQQAAHIFPHSALNPKNPATVLTWRFIQIFLGPKNTKLLARELWSEDKGINTSKNGITIVMGLHGHFDRGKFSLMPVRLGEVGDHEYLDVEVGFYAADSTIKRILTADKLSVEEQYIFRKGEAPQRDTEDQDRYLNDGDMIRITTPDKKDLPLPSHILLYWHRHLWGTLTSAGLGSSQSESKEEDPRDLMLQRRQRAQRPVSSPLGTSSKDAGEGSSSRGRQGYDGAGDQDQSNDERTQRTPGWEAKFIAFLEKITVPEDFDDCYASYDSDDYYYE